jgi:hypothetical protein
MYLTHFGRVGDVTRLGALQLELLERMVELGRAERQSPDRQAALERGLLAICTASLAEHGCRLDPAAIAALLSMDIKLNAQGLAVWLDR